MLIGVVGGGVMGSGIARAFAAAGLETVLADADLPAARRACERLWEKLDREADRGRLDRAEAERVRANLRPGRLEDMREAGLALETVTEDLAVKRAVLAGLDGLCGPETMLATNTSSLSVAELNEGLSRPLMGLHFFNPVDRMELVEVVAGPRSGPNFLQRARTLVEALGKTPVTVGDSPGFVVNRLLLPMMNEAVTLLAEGRASAGDIDAALRLGGGHPLGPLALADLIGLDVCLAALESLHRHLGDKYRPHPLWARLVAEGRLGRKSGAGFHLYHD